MVDEPAERHPRATEQIFGALMGQKPVAIQSVQTTIEFRLALTPEQAHALYNELYRLQRACGFPDKREWRDEYVELFGLYDALFQAGVDGTGP